MAEAIELLISEGHVFSEVRKYSIPQLMLFLNLISTRYDRSAPDSQKDKKDGGEGRIVKTSYRGDQQKRQYAPRGGE
jgi:hypothetical protein